MKKIIGVLIIFLSLWGCSGGEKELSTGKLRELVISAASGSKTANDSLGGIFRLSSIPGKPETVMVDTLSFSGRKFLGVAVQFNNPLNNRFALYDEYLNCYLIDKSLNGNLLLNAVRENNFRYFTLEETYFSNDKTALKRFSIFRGDTSGFNLAFRTYIMMKTPDALFIQDLYEITSEMVRTNIKAPAFSGLNDLNDDYIFDKNLNIYYVRKAIYFDEFVTEFINSIKDTTNSFIAPLASTGKKDVDAIFEFTSGSTPEYYLSLNENWRELRNKPGFFLKKNITGSKFVNDILGSNIYVFKIPLYEAAEDYITINLDGKVNGKYTVRFSKEFEEDDYIKRFFEYSCKTKKFLLLFSAAKNTYLDNKQEYSEIINTFYIDC
jgi:hypothetical protein